jgi:hypothetical protein
MLRGIMSYRAGPTNLLRLIQRITKWGIIILTILVSLSGLMYYEWFAVIFDDFLFFSWHLQYDLALVIFVIIHIGVSTKFYFTRNRINHWSSNLFIVSLVLSLTITVIYINIPPELVPNKIQIGSEIYSFDPDEVNTARPDLFQNESFSVFDVLVHLNITGKINLKYHFDANMDTYVIESLNGQNNWWYIVYYSGGQSEKNTVRMDYYPWKLGTRIILYQENPTFIAQVFSTFEEEVTRLANNNGTVIIPIVIINGRTFDEEFYNVSVSAHNMRSDIFKNGTVTALDVIMTLGDLGNITYSLRYIYSMGRGTYVRNYFVQKINNDENVGRCGFVYDVGDEDFKYIGLNFIFLASDARILKSPEYLRFFWTCL